MAADTTANGAKTSLKLMLHKGENRVIFAEADSHFVDALFSLMILPMGTIVRLLEKFPDEKLKPLGSLKNLYQSLVDIPVNFLSNEDSKFMMLNPRSSSYELCRKLKLNIDDTEPTKYYICKNFRCIFRSDAVFSICNFATCSYCGGLINFELERHDLTIDTGGGVVDGCVFVSNVTTYIVTDDLRVKPNTSSFSVKLLCDLGITDASHLEERTFVGNQPLP